MSAPPLSAGRLLVVVGLLVPATFDLRPAMGPLATPGTYIPEGPMGLGLTANINEVDALSYGMDVQPGGDHLEEVTVKTLGLRNTNVEVELAGVKVPLALLGTDHPKPREVESICDSHCPPLRGRIALQMTRKLLRPAVPKT